MNEDRQTLPFPPIWPGHERLAGKPRFMGTREPVKTLFGHLEADDALDVFLEDVASVSRQHAEGVLWIAFDSTVTRVVEARQSAEKAKCGFCSTPMSLTGWGFNRLGMSSQLRVRAA